MTLLPVLMCAVLLSLGVAGQARAQTDDHRPEIAPQEEQRLNRIIADRLARSALIYLRRIDDPVAQDFRIVALTLEEALELVPNDVELHRLTLEAWHAAGNDRRALEATRRLVRMDPDDTVAQLRLISSRINRLQSVEERRAMYDRLLDQGAGALSHSIQSRLALDDALLAREVGDNERFVRRMTLATTLDPTNKPAAVLAATYALDRITDPVARVEMLVNVLLADPLDPSAHIGLADELFRHGAFASAHRFYEHAATLHRMRGRRASSDLAMRIMLTTWATRGTQHFLDMLAEIERTDRFRIRKQREAAQLAGEDPNQVPGYRPTIMHETLRLIAATAIDDDVDMAAAMDRVKALTRESIEAIRNPPPGADGEPQQIDPAQAAASVREWLVNLLWLRVWAGMDMDEAAQMVEELEEAESLGVVTPGAIRRFRGIIEARLGDMDRAVELLTPLAETDPRARIGLGIAAERRGDLRAAMRHYARIAMDEPGSMIGIWTRFRIEHLLQQPVEPTSVARSIEQYCKNIPRELDRMIHEPYTMVHLEAEQTKLDLAPLERIEMRIKIRNVSPIPLAVGPRAPISSDLLLAPRLTIGSQQIIDQVRPEVISMDRRLRLMPGESVEAVIWAGQGQTGAVIDLTVANSTLLRWRLTQGFGVNADGDYVPTPFSASAITSVARRPPLQPPAGGVAELGEHIRNETGAELFKSLMIITPIIQVIQQRAGVEPAIDFINTIAEVLTERVQTMTAFERAFLVMTMPSTQAAESLRPVETILRDDASRIVRLMYLYTRTTSADDEIFSIAAEGDDPVVREVGRRLQERIREVSGAPGETPFEPAN